jgi:hypothetical protein
MHGVGQDRFHKIKEQLEQIFKIKGSTKILMALVIMKGINEGPIEDWITMWKGKVDLMEVWTAHNWVDQLPNRFIQEERMRTCGRIERGPLQVQVDGIINACCFDWDGRLAYGNLYKQTLSEIFSGDRFNAILGAHQTGNYDGMICRNCDQLNSDKTEALIFSSKYSNKEERVKMTSTCYDKVLL